MPPSLSLANVPPSRAPRLDTFEFVRAALGCVVRERAKRRGPLDESRRVRLERLLRHAQATTGLGAERLRGLDPADPSTLARIASITKDEIMSQFEESVADRALTLDEVRAFSKDRARAGHLYRGRYVVATTSGTTGRVGYFVSEGKDWAATNGALFGRILRHRLVPHEVLRFCFGRRYRMAMLIATEGHFITHLVSSFRPLLTRAMVTMQTFSVMDAQAATIEGLNRLQPHYLHSYPTSLESLAHAQLAGRLAIEPEFISLGSEPVAPTARQTIRRAFPTAEVSETYGATECLVMANQCRHGRLHVNEDLAIVEPVDEQGRPAPRGTPSAKVLVTNLINSAQPLIRYELQDSVLETGEVCPCGSPMTVVEVQGRSDDTFFFADSAGRYQAHPPIPFETLFLDIPGLAQYQLVHETQNQLRIRFVPEAESDAAETAGSVLARFRKYLAKNQLAECVQVAVEPVRLIEREAAGHKLRQVYSKVPRPSAAA